MKNETAIVLTIVVCVLIAFTGILTYSVTIRDMQKQAVANGCGHYTIVQGGVEFAWGQP